MSKLKLLPYSIVRDFRILYEEKVSSLIASLNYRLQERGVEQTKVECHQHHSQVEDLSKLKFYELSARLKNSKVVIIFDITVCDWTSLEVSKKWTFKGNYDLSPDYKTGSLGHCLKLDETYDSDSLSKTYTEREKEHQIKRISSFFVRKNDK